MEATAHMLEVKAPRYYANDTDQGFALLTMVASGAATDTTAHRLSEAYVKRSWLLPKAVNNTSLSCPCYDQWHAWCVRYYSGTFSRRNFLF